MVWTATGAIRPAVAFAATGALPNTSRGARHWDGPNSFARRASSIMGGGSTSSSSGGGGGGGRGLIIDTDVGFDDIVAIRCLALLAGLELDERRPGWSLVTTVGGISPPGYGAECLRRLFPSHHVAAGRTSVRAQKVEPEWLKIYRKKLHLFVEGEDSGDELSTETERPDDHSNRCNDLALSRVHDALQGSRDESVDLLCLGPLTNVAHWIESHGSLLERKVRGIWIMGGNQPAGVGGVCAESVSEFNFSQDPAAAAAVLRCPGLACRVHLITQEQSSRSRFDDLQACHGGGVVCSLETTIATHAEAEAPGGLLSRVLRVDPSAVYYDPVAAYASVVAAKSEFLRCGRIPIRVDLTSGAVLLAQSNELDENGDGHAVRFVSDIALTGEGGYVAWIKSAIEKERADIETLIK